MMKVYPILIISSFSNHTGRLKKIGLFLVALLGVLVLLTGCARDHDIIELDYHFSMNIARTPLDFPHPKMALSPAQSEVITRLGPPDYIRFWWRPDGSFITSRDLAAKDAHAIGKEMGNCDKSWLYTHSNEEVLFYRNGGYKKQPLSEVLKLVCKYGDPNDAQPPLMRDGHRHETWIWMEHGLKVRLIDGQEVERSHFPATGSGTYLLK